MRGKATGRYNFHGDVFVAPDRIVATADVAPDPPAEAGVHAFDIVSGRRLWTRLMGRGIAGAVTGAARRVFVYTIGGDLVSLDLESGKQEWTFPANASGWESPATLGSRVFAGSGDGIVYALKSDTGRVDWEQRLRVPVSTSIRAGSAGVYVGTNDGSVHRLHAASGNVLSSVKADEVLQPAGAPLVTSNAVLVLLVDREANYRALVSLDPDAGRVNWRRPAPDRWSTSRVFASRETIVLGTPTGEVTAYCVADGSPAWSHTLAAAPIRSIGGTDDGTLFVGTVPGSLYAVKATASCAAVAR